jgi:hypothetical protein
MISTTSITYALLYLQAPGASPLFTVTKDVDERFQ